MDYNVNTTPKGISNTDTQTARIHPDRAVQTAEAIQRGPVSVRGAVQTMISLQMWEGFVGV